MTNGHTATIANQQEFLRLGPFRKRQIKAMFAKDKLKSCVIRDLHMLRDSDQ